MNTPFVSVIIPNYNHAEFLDLRISSILQQSYKNFEVIILDDKSSDNSCEIIEKYKIEKKITHIIYNEINSGSTFKQWKRGFDLAGGELIWIAESDDYADENFLMRLVECFLMDDSAVLAFSNSYLIDRGGAIMSKDIDFDYKPEMKYLVNDVIDGNVFIKRKMLYSNRIYNASSVVFKASTLKSIDDNFMEYRLCGDWLFWLELLNKGKVVWVHQKLNYFRIHDKKVTPCAMKKGLNYEEFMKIFNVWRRKLNLSLLREYCVVGNVYLQIFRSNVISIEARESVLNLWERQYPFKYFYIVCRVFDYVVNKLLDR